MTRFLGFFAVAAFLLASGPASAQKNKISDGRDLLGAMHDRYEGKWFRSAVSTQDNTLYGPHGKEAGHCQWDHHLQVPGKLRIDFLPASAGAGVLIVNDTQYVFQGGKLMGQRAGAVALLTLAFDAFVQPPEKSAAQLEGLKYDLSQLRTDRWQNQKVYVVGAKEGDLSSPQFWVDQDHLYTVRVIEPEIGKGDTVHIRDVQFGKYQKFGKGWIAPVVMMYVDGKPQRLEEYH